MQIILTFLFYCVIISDHKLSHLKQHIIVSHSVCGAGVWAQLPWVLSKAKVLVRAELSSGRSHGDGSPSRLTLAADRIHLLVLVGLTSLCWLEAGGCPSSERPAATVPNQDALSTGSLRTQQLASSMSAREGGVCVQIYKHDCVSYEVRLS